MKNALRATRQKTRRTIFRRMKPCQPTLQFTPYAWAKLLYLRDLGDTEVGGFGISRCDDLLLVEDFRLVRQTCSSASVEFDDAAVADFFDQQVDQGRKPEEFGRLWLHTHPADSAEPSGVDEETFARCFGRADWTVMFILARGGQSYARLRFGVGPGGDVEIPVEVDFAQPFATADHAAWKAEYGQSVVRFDSELDGLFQAGPDDETWSLPDEGDWFETWGASPDEAPEDLVLEGLQ